VKMAICVHDAEQPSGLLLAVVPHLHCHGNYHGHVDHGRRTALSYSSELSRLGHCLLNQPCGQRAPAEVESFRTLLHTQYIAHTTW
jgi:hypothetical protein